MSTKNFIDLVHFQTPEAKPKSLLNPDQQHNLVSMLINLLKLINIEII